MKRFVIIVLTLVATMSAMAQKPRPDAFPPIPDSTDAKGVKMAHTFDDMANWDRYPDYPVYLAMMRHFVEKYPTLCHLDTIGTSEEGRLILSLAITGDSGDTSRPEFFYSATMHGDEVTGFYLMLRLCDTLLSSYGTSPTLTNLLNTTRIYINPLSNPDGTYHGGDSSLAFAWRYNANFVDLNRNYPDPFGTAAFDTLQKENSAMINYVTQHHFLLSANLHGGSEVMNYPWDSFTSSERPNEHSEWWKAVSKRFVDTARRTDAALFRDVIADGYINGGDWYVISNGRQDYFNYYNNMREITMELSHIKILPTTLLSHYWNCLSPSLINYIKEIHHLENPAAIPSPIVPHYNAYPNPTHGPVILEGPQGSTCIDLSGRPAGIYLLEIDGHHMKIIKY